MQERGEGGGERERNAEDRKRGEGKAIVIHFGFTHIRRDVDATDVSRLHEEHVVLEGVSSRIREHAVPHHDVHIPTEVRKTTLHSTPEIHECESARRFALENRGSSSRRKR